MKPTKILTILLAIALLGSAILVIKPVFATGYTPGAPVFFSAEPVALTCTDINASLYGLETPGGSSPIGQTFNLNLYMNNATVTNVPAGITGLAVQLNFSNILSFAQPVSYTDDLCTPSGVFNNIPFSKLLVVDDGLFDNTLTQIGGSGPGVYTGATQVVIGVAEKTPLVPWNGSRALIATVEFNITSQPGLGDNNATGTLDWITGGTGATTVPSSTYISFDVIGGTVQIDAANTLPQLPNVYFDQSLYDESAATLGTLFNITVMINANQWWCISGFDINVTFDPSMINLVANSTGTALSQLNSNPWTGFFLNGSGWVDGYFSASAASAGGSLTVIGSLMELEFNVTLVGSSFPAPTCHIAFQYVDLVSWIGTARALPPWSGHTLPVDLAGYFTVGTYSVYLGPVVTAGPSIDLYDQYPAPYGGQGPNKHSDAFSPQQNVTLYANVTQGGYRVINKLVVFEIFDANGTKITILQNTTDNYGIATVMFRIPQPANLTDPNVFGWWEAIATVDIDQMVVNDTMWFQVGWLVWVDSITPNGSPYMVATGNMNFTMVVGTISEQNRSVLLSVDAFDEASYPIGEIAWTMTVHAVRNMTYDGPGSTITVYYTFGPVTGPLGAKYYGWDSTGVPGYYEVIPYSGTNIIMEVPNWARIGQGTVAGYALTDWPSNGGTPYAPAAYNTFGIVHP